MDIDPEFYNEEISEEWSDNFFDDIYDTPSDQDTDESLHPDDLNADQLGLAMAFGEFVVDDRNEYDIDEDTDGENWEGVMELYPLQGVYHSKDARSLSKFEQYIDGITSGQFKGPWHRD